MHDNPHPLGRDAEQVAHLRRSEFRYRNDVVGAAGCIAGQPLKAASKFGCRKVARNDKQVMKSNNRAPLPRAGQPLIQPVEQGCAWSKTVNEQPPADILWNACAKRRRQGVGPVAPQESDVLVCLAQAEKDLSGVDANAGEILTEAVGSIESDGAAPLLDLGLRPLACPRGSVIVAQGLFRA
jgi:hypothetical protein